MKTDKITAQIIDAVKRIESDTQDFAERRHKLLEKFKEIYTASDLCYEDLIARKSFLQNSRKNYLSILLTLLLGLFVSYVFNVWNIVTITNPYIQIGLNVLFVSFMILISYPLSEKLSDIIYISDGKFDRYDTNEFEIKLIHAILEETFHYEKAIKDILDIRFDQGNPSYKNDKRIKRCTRRICRRKRRRQRYRKRSNLRAFHQARQIFDLSRPHESKTHLLHGPSSCSISRKPSLDKPPSTGG